MGCYARPQLTFDAGKGGVTNFREIEDIIACLSLVLEVLEAYSNRARDRRDVSS